MNIASVLWRLQDKLLAHSSPLLADLKHTSLHANMKHNDDAHPVLSNLKKWSVFRVHLMTLPTLCIPFPLTTDFLNQHFPQTTGVFKGKSMDAKMAQWYSNYFTITLKRNFLAAVLPS